MDWSKAKTILIVAFLATNIVLFTVLSSSERATEPTIRQEFIEEVIGILRNKDIFLDIEIPREIPNLKTLIVEYEIIDASKINEDFFLGEGFVRYKENNVVEISNDKEFISIKNNKILKYRSNNRTRSYKELDEQKAQAIALEFLEDRGYSLEDTKLTHIQEGGGSYKLSFSKIYNASYLEKAYMNIVVDFRGVRELERIWLNVKDEGETLIYINTAPKAILDLLSMENIYGKTIIDMSLCYYFDPNQHEYIKKPEETRKGKTIPAWRVLFDDGSLIIIDNY